MEQIEESWTIAKRTTLMAMLIEAHKSASNTINGSLTVFAVANSCSIHLCLATDGYPRQVRAGRHNWERITIGDTRLDDNGDESDERDENDYEGNHPETRSETSCDFAMNSSPQPGTRSRGSPLKRAQMVSLSSICLQPKT